ncbi:MAG: cation:proton antiporter [Acidimicrobiales bacterium]|nr:cation:proton antiporter [Acidimicrobiales bacterium]
MTDGLAAFALLAWLAYLASRVLARRNLPELIGFLLVGAVLGPSALGLVSEEDLVRLQPVTEIALAVLMFVIGERASARALKAARWSVTAGVAQFVLSGFGVFFAAEWAGAERSVALMLAALAGAGAPLTIAHVVSSAKVSSPYTRGLVSTHAVSDALATTTFAAILPVATLLTNEDASVWSAAADFVQLGIGGALIGVVGGLLIARLGHQIETSGELLLFVGVHLLLGWAVSQQVEISLPLAALVAGATAASVSPVSFTQRLFRTIKSIEQPLYLLFFALAGASIHLEDVPEVGVIGLAYIVVRVIAKVAGALIGGPVGGLGWRASLRLGVDLTPQAGVAVGLAVLASEAIPGPGVEAATVVLGSVVLFELIGPLLVMRNLGLEKRSTTDDSNTSVPEVNFDEVPEKVLVAAPSAVDPPEWLLNAAARWHAKVYLLVPGDDESKHVERVERLTEAGGCEFEFVALTSESFTGAVVRAQASTGADLVVLFGTRQLGSTSRLALMPAERIARQLAVPVLTFPVPEAGPPEPEPGAGRFWPFS